MKNGSTITTLFFAFAFLVIAQVALVISMTQPQPQQTTIPQAIEPSHERYQQSPMMAVMWRTPNADGMAPLSVLQSTVKRMQYEQTTPLGNDQTAKALVKVLEAVAILEGRETVTAEGFPIIE